LDSKGMTISEVQAHLKDGIHTNISNDLISIVTDGIVRSYCLAKQVPRQVYPILYLDCIRIKASDNNTIINKMIYGFGYRFN
jgi:putative transposase